MKWTGLLIVWLACLPWHTNAFAQAVLDGQGLAVTGGLSMDGFLVVDDLRHNAIPADLWIAHEDGRLQSCSPSGACTDQGDQGDAIYSAAVFTGRLWIGHSDGTLQSCDSSGACTGEDKGFAIRSMEVFNGRLWIGHSDGMLQSCDSSGACTGRGNKGYGIVSMAVFSGRLWIGQLYGELQSCNGLGECISHGIIGDSIYSMAVFNERLWIGQGDGVLQSCDGSGECISHGSKGSMIRDMAVFNERLWIGQYDGVLQSCDGSGACEGDDQGARIATMEVFNGRLWIGQSDGMLQSCSSSGGCTGNDQGEPIYAMALFHPTSLGGALFTRQGNRVGVGTSQPLIALDVASQLDGGPTVWTSHLAGVENLSTDSNADVLALKVNIVDPGSSNNFITFFGGSGAVGAVEGTGSGGIAMVTGGADFAEYLPRLQPDEPLAPGDVVGLFPNGVTRKIEGALRAMAVSTSPIVVGNLPPSPEEDRFVRVAFFGRTPVKVRGPVQAGDWIVATKRRDGIGVSREPARIEAAELRRVVGKALESSADESLKTVDVLVGLSHEQVLAVSLEMRKREAKKLLSQNERGLSELQTRLAAVEERLNEILSAYSNPSGTPPESQGPESR